MEKILSMMKGAGVRNPDRKCWMDPLIFQNVMLPSCHSKKGNRKIEGYCSENKPWNTETMRSLGCKKHQCNQQAHDGGKQFFDI